ncbi:MAG TPA: VapC toxin family PIN domain ribonuclease, partial [Caulobacteraceae bacterium]|nr:VapC toxin family PIN domain ribonuclease [Caulobacteraceae bacterium]
WFAAEGNGAWATCPIIQNGVLRIVGNARYPGGSSSPATVASVLKAMTALPGHAFWPDHISLLDHDSLDPERLLTSAQVTDSYLLALACANGGQLATFDRRLICDAVHGGTQGLRVIG